MLSENSTSDITMKNYVFEIMPRSRLAGLKAALHEIPYVPEDSCQPLNQATTSYLPLSKGYVKVSVDVNYAWEVARSCCIPWSGATIDEQNMCLHQEIESRSDMSHHSKGWAKEGGFEKNKGDVEEEYMTHIVDLKSK
ncbi:hypothetical protein TNCV_2979071 [Trichonephila clavipes]|nr:hypothetical protein TNCV_2979071 [Trichonephila clavipes]